MTTTVYPDTESATGDTGKLKVNVCDKLAAKKGAIGPEQQAELFGIHRSTFYRLRNGDRIASLPVALRMASRLGTTVHRLFEEFSDEAAAS